MPGVVLSDAGRRQSALLAERLAGAPLRAVYSSPLERAQETAAPLAARLGLAVETEPALNEIDIGEWTGRGLDELRDEPLWQAFNLFRSGTRPPGGETMLEVQSRIVRFLDELRRRHPDEPVAAISHADILKSAVLYYLGMPLDLFLRIEIEPASVTVLELADWGPRLLLLNETAATHAPPHPDPLPEGRGGAWPAAPAASAR
jgi:broad specificity phosphatase PhoE